LISQDICYSLGSRGRQDMVEETEWQKSDDAALTWCYYVIGSLCLSCLSRISQRLTRPHRQFDWSVWGNEWNLEWGSSPPPKERHNHEKIGIISTSCFNSMEVRDSSRSPRTERTLQATVNGRQQEPVGRQERPKRQYTVDSGAPTTKQQQKWHKVGTNTTPPTSWNQNCQCKRWQRT
jgi:hypothetical protein